LFRQAAGGQNTSNGWKVAGISGIRSLEDVTALKEKLGRDFVLINVYISDPQVVITAW